MKKEGKKQNNGGQYAEGEKIGKRRCKMKEKRENNGREGNSNKRTIRKKRA